MASGGVGRRGRRQKPRAKGKGRAKKTKYLSLSDLIKAEVDATPAPTPTPGDEPASPRSPWEEAEVKLEGEGGDGGGAGTPPPPQQQVEPFALHHEASTLFEALPAPSLSEILGPSPSASPDGGSGSSGLPGAEEEDLARRALRGRERWVYCSGGSASSPTATTTATTSSSSPCSSAASTGASARSLRLKLDYEEILAAWADRGSLYIGTGAGGGGKPGLELDAVRHARSLQRLLVHAGLGDASVSVTPVPPSSAQEVLVEVEPSEHAVAATRAPDTAPGRAERVMRYKEKRRRRLFAKRIRYEVRRVNAVRRPRFKGRFIKEHEEFELQPT